MAITAIDMQKASGGNLLRRAYIEDMRMESPLVDEMRFITTGKVSVTAKRWLTLPTPGFRAANAAYSENTGRTTDIAGAIFPLGKYSDVDVIYMRDNSAIENPRKTQDKMNAIAMTRTMVDRAVNGDGAIDPYGFDGWKVMLNAGPSSQRIDAGAVDISTSASRGTNGYAMLSFIDQLIDAVEGRPSCLVMSKVTKRYLADIAHQKSMWKTTTDQLGRRVDNYDGIPIITAGYKVDDETEVLATNHDGTTGKTSIYAPVFGENDLVMLQQYPMEVIDHGRMETISKYRTEVDWPLGQMLLKKRSLARLFNIKVA